MNTDNNIRLIATCKFGLEMVVRREVQDLGFQNVVTTDGRVEFDAIPSDIPTVNMWLRAAERVLLKVATFSAVDFDELFDQTGAIAWEQWIPANGYFPVNAKVHKSQIDSARSTQSIVKKAIVERLMTAHDTDELPETGAEYIIQVAIRKDEVLMTLDTSGEGLHRRGYRLEAGLAPLRETMAAALVMLSFWNSGRLLVDPFCGSGTILIEAAMIGRNIAPGLNRQFFASEEWPFVDGWDEARKLAETAVTDTPLQLFGYDIDPNIIPIAKRNAERAGVADDITFAVKDVKELWIDQEHGIVITNLPYGERVSDYTELNKIYVSLHKTFRKKKGWSLFFLTADTMFRLYFKRATPNRSRKLYNGNIRVYYYQYHGEKQGK